MQSIDKILKRYSDPASSIIQVLQDIQHLHNYLPEKVLEYVASRIHVPLARIYSIATFYSAFSLKPRGEHLVTVCMGTACHLRGAPTILEELERRLGIKPFENTKDMKYSLETVNCLGCCAIGPIVVKDGTYHGEFRLDDVSKLLEEPK